MARREKEKVVRAIKGRRSAEVKGRARLAQARPRWRTFAEVLASMPDVGVDADFERVDSVGRSRHEFD